MSLENKTTEEVAELLLRSRKNGYYEVKQNEIEKADEFNEGYKTFLDEGKTEREVVDYAIKLAEENGYVPFDYNAKYKTGDKVYLNQKGKSFCMAIIGKNGTDNGVKIAAAHIDSPRIDLKPIPLYESNGLAMLKTHYYGGIRKYQWVAMPLAMHGVVCKKNGETVTIKIGENEGDTQFCITDLLPHLGREQSQKTLGQAFTGEDLNITMGSRPYGEDGTKDAFKLNILKLLYDSYGIVEEDLTSAEIEFVPAFKANDVGLDRSLVGAYGHDDRVCAYPAMQAILDAEPCDQTIITVLVDKEEVGSQGNTGLQCDFLYNFISDLAEIDGNKPRHIISKSSCLSADVTAAYDPNYPSAFEANNSCYVNNGVGLAKYTGSGGKGGCNDANAEFVATVRRIFDENEVLWQIGELGRVDLGGGGTVSKIVANMDMEVIDVGVPVLSMHAPWEVVSKLDVYMAYKGFKSYFED